MIRALWIRAIRARAPVAAPATGYTTREALEAAWNGPLGHPTHKADWQIVSLPGSNAIGLVAAKGDLSAACRALTDRIRAIKRSYIDSLYRGDSARI